jgi:anti-sigma regulatory factor (Ser/Thr protein kinase)
MTSTTLCLHGGLDAPAAVRHWLLGLDGWPSEQRRDEVALMLCEVVTNAVLHGGVGPEAELRIDVVSDEHGVTFRVYDCGRGFLPPRLDQPHRGRGYGLFILDRLAHRWGVRRVPGGACVWFEALVDGGLRG